MNHDDIDFMLLSLPARDVLVTAGTPPEIAELAGALHGHNEESALAIRERLPRLINASRSQTSFYRRVHHLRALHTAQPAQPHASNFSENYAAAAAVAAMLCGRSDVLDARSAQLCFIAEKAYPQWFLGEPLRMPSYMQLSFYTDILDSWCAV